MTEQYSYFMWMQELRDQNVMILGGLALGFVVSWLTVPFIPLPPVWLERVKGLYQVGGLVVYLGILLAAMGGML